MARVWVTIPTSGVWPTQVELAARNAIVDALAEAGVGDHTGSGGGRGEMDFSFVVVDAEAARVAIEVEIQARLPDAEYRIRAVE